MFYKVQYFFKKIGSGKHRVNQHLVGEAEMLVISTPGKKRFWNAAPPCILGWCSSAMSHKKKKNTILCNFTQFSSGPGQVPIKNATFTDFMFMQIYILHIFTRHFYCPDYENFPDFTFHILVLRISFPRQWTCFPVSC
jgi:hypothetical protein